MVVYNIPSSAQSDIRTKIFWTKTDEEQLVHEGSEKDEEEGFRERVFQRTRSNAEENNLCQELIS